MQWHQARANLQLRAVLLQAELNLQNVDVDMQRYLACRRRHRRAQQQRRWWSRARLSPLRRRQFGLYDQLMVELRCEDPQAFCNFMRMPPAMFDEILVHVGPRFMKQYTWMRDPIEPGMKLAITLHHLASGAKYMDMRYGWRVPHNTISIIVREVTIFYYHLNGVWCYRISVHLY